jgi:hypothetical protein
MNLVELTIDVLPTPLPDETLYNLVSRIGSLNGHQNAPELCAALLGPGDGIRVGDAPIDLKHFYRATRHAYCDAQSAPSSLTTSDFFSRLGLSEQGKFDLADPQIPRSKNTAIGNHPGLVELSHGHSHIFRWCPSCITDDIANYGTAYWHLPHQLPASTICTEHLTPLLEVRIPFRMRQQGFFSPAFLPDNILSQTTRAIGHASPHATGLSVFAKDILLDSSQPSNLVAVLGAILDGLTDMGLVTRSGNIRMKEFSVAFSDSYQDLADCQTFSTQLSKASLSRVAKSIETLSQPIPAAATIMLGYWLYSLWGFFRSRIKWRQATSVKPEGVLTRHSDVQSGTQMPKVGSRDRHRHACLDFLDTNPIASRSDFWHKHYVSCRWLARYDGAWLDCRLPILSSSSPTQLEFAFDEDKKPDHPGS